MTAFLTIAGIDIEVSQDAANEAQPEVGGDDVRAFDMSLLSEIGPTKRRWEFESGWLSEANYNTLRNATADRAHVICTGDALDNNDTTCRVDITAAPFVPDNLGFVRIARLTLIEV